MSDDWADYEHYAPPRCHECGGRHSHLRCPGVVEPDAPTLRLVGDEPLKWRENE